VAPSTYQPPERQPVVLVDPQTLRGREAPQSKPKPKSTPKSTPKPEPEEDGSSPPTGPKSWMIQNQNGGKT
jgi:hypothetical protein